MDHPNMVLGKRARLTRADLKAIEAAEAPPKRSRARRSERTASGAVATGPRNGLLTPEPSALAESQIPTSDAGIEAAADRDKDADTDTDIRDPKMIFPFMKLPAELRLNIYHMALVRPSPLTLHATRAPDSSSSADPSASGHVHPQVLSSTCLPSTAIRSAAPTRTTAPVYPSDPVVPVILRLNKQIHKEARQLLYAENVFTLSLASGIYTLSTLHQRSRSLIKHVVLTIPSHHDILDGFADLVRLGLRYCWGLKSFKIILHASLPDDGRVSGATSVYANAFHILRWLPRGCSVVLEGSVSEAVTRVVAEEGRLMSVLDETSYLKRQHQMPERH